MPDINDVLSRDLNDEQRRAVQDENDEILTLACAGSGKSRTLAYRIVRLLAQGTSPKNIVAFTFTNKAAESIKRRVSKALSAAGMDPNIISPIYIGTIDSYCSRILSRIDARYRQFDVLDDNRLKLYLMSRYSELNLQSFREEKGESYFGVIRGIANSWKIMNNELMTPQQISEVDPHLGQILDQIATVLNRDRFIDFSNVIRLVVEALRAGNQDAKRAVGDLQHLLVDEYQDVNAAQEELINQLHLFPASLFVVGDDDQAIYSWRGADVNNILTFQERYPNCHVHTLSINYRSTQRIVETADAFARAALGASRYEKNPRHDVDKHPQELRKLWFPSRTEEAAWVASQISTLMGTAYEDEDGTRGLTPGDFAILMRSTKNNHQDFTIALDRSNLRYDLDSSGSIFKRPYATALRNTFQLFRNSTPTREAARTCFDASILPYFPYADFEKFTRVLTEWGNKIHAPPGGARQRLFPQVLVFELLNSFGLDSAEPDITVMADLGTFSRIIQDIESVYVSVDSKKRFDSILNFLENIDDNVGADYDASSDDIVRRPDTITVSTVHQMKGLEFPVVFVVDVEPGHFPLKRSGYRGWIPIETMGRGPAPGVYVNDHLGEARLFYTALTRAERFLFVSGSAGLPSCTRDKKPSTFWLRLDGALLQNASTPIAVGQACTPRPRNGEDVVPTSYSDIRYYLRCPCEYKFRKRFGFSPAIQEMMGFGKTVHTAVGKLHEKFPDHAPSASEAQNISDGIFHLKHVYPSRDPVNRPGAFERAKDQSRRILGEYSTVYSTDFNHLRQVELDFEIPVGNAVISGAIDLLLSLDDDGKIIGVHVIDFKTMEGRDEPLSNDELEWTDIALQVQLYARASEWLLGQSARNGSVHFLKDNQRVEVPVSEDAVRAAVGNVVWAVERILDDDFPMRPHTRKCASCDFSSICPKRAEQFKTSDVPPEILTPTGRMQVLAFREFSGNTEA